MKQILYILTAILLTACNIQTDYYFQKNKEVRMSLKVDMSGIFAMMPDSDEKPSFGNISDSLEQSGLADSLRAQGLKDVVVSFDTNRFIMDMAGTFKDIDHYNKYLNEDRDPAAKPIKASLSKSAFSLENSNSLIPSDFFDNMEQDDETMAQMAGMMNFKTVYHFPYEVDKLTSESGSGVISEDGKSVSFTNTFQQFTDQSYKGDFMVTFK